MLHTKPRLTRQETAQLLTESGYKISHRTLAKLACIGGGPEFQKFGRTPLYCPRKAISWAESKTSQPVSSTSELGA